MAEISIQRLAPHLLDDWLDYFDHDAFEDNPEWAGCYCYWFHAGKVEWSEATPEHNRTASSALIRAGVLRGYLAYAGGRPVGWCQAAPRLEIPNIAGDPELAVDDADRVGSIVCFNVAAGHRRRGVAGALLEAACSGFAKEGLQIVEAYPRRSAAGDAANYHGPLEMYLRAGFKPHRELPETVIVRREAGLPAADSDPG